ncbi:unnamed protein product [Arabis nemorensis]|uniref:non-specific serine/threonine protein kinase n=1 Tax=Arabis nemorensis TaxID=586526 RepID=A0A565AS98_9BRAS|nr:unnamed protein product [Arabis nemorensis]
MSISILLTISVFFSVARFPSCFSVDQQYEQCLSPPICGSEVFPNNTTYPFWGNELGKPNFCGQKEFELSCKDNQILTLEIRNLKLRVVSVKPDDKSITVADESLREGRCPQIMNFNGDDQFTKTPTTETIDLFQCNGTHQPISVSSRITCQHSNESWSTTYLVFGSSIPPRNCFKVGEIPMLRSAKDDLLHSNETLKMALRKGFELRYTIEDKICLDCSSSSGICGSESESGNFRCLCQDKPHNSSCSINDDQGYVHFEKGIDFAQRL